MRYVHKPCIIFLSTLAVIAAWVVFAQDELLPETLEGFDLLEQPVATPAKNTNVIDQEIGEVEAVLNGAAEKGVSDGLDALPEELPEALPETEAAIDVVPVDAAADDAAKKEQALDAFLEELDDEPVDAAPEAVVPEAVEDVAVEALEAEVLPDPVETEAVEEATAVDPGVEEVDLGAMLGEPEKVDAAGAEPVEEAEIDLDALLGESESTAADESMPAEGIDLDEPILATPEDAVEDLEELDLDALMESGTEPAATDSDLDELLAAPPAPEPVAEPGVPMADPVPAAPPAAPAGSVAAEIDVAELIAITELRRKAIEQHMRDTLVLADTSLEEGHNEDAIALYEEVLRLLREMGGRTENLTDRRAAQQGLAEGLYRRAKFLFERDNLETALAQARRSVGMGHEEAMELAAEIRDTIENPPAPVVPERKARWEEKGFLIEQQTIQERLRAGREYVAAGELDDATTMFKSVLSRDPENTEAIRLLQKIGRLQYDSESAKLSATREEMLAGVRSTWTPDYYELSEEDIEIWAKWQQRQRPAPDGENERIKIINKMRSIKIPEIDFRQANINDVIKFLQDASVEFDEISEDEEIKGVNIILNLAAGGDKQKAAAPVSDDPFALATGDAGGGGGPGGDVPLITFSARYINLHEALKIVTEVANLKFRVSGSVVMVVPFDAPVGDILTRTYTVLPSVGERINAMQNAFTTDDRRGGEDFIALEAVSAGPSRGDWKTFFAELGVEWPAGSSVKYIPAIGKIVVANTSDNLTVFEQVLAELNVVPNQIEIEARFVEVSQTDLESFGFEWNLTDDWEVAQKKGQEDLALGDRERISIGATSLTAGNRYANDEGAIGAETVAEDALLSVASILTNPEIQMILHMLQQSGSSDLLSAPKVTTQSGVPATLKVVTEYIYPTSFEVSGIRGNNNSNNNNSNGGTVGAVVEPSTFETREVGVILQVTPEVSPEGQMITLEMMPEVVSDPEWFNYGSTYTDADGQVQTLNMPQPFFHSRSVQTMISIYNGATVVMGGMITENRTTIEDKIPFLGDIPIVGRLFQSQVESSEKRNLLIFVTARLVDPAGRPVKSGDQGLIGQELIEQALDQPE